MRGSGKRVIACLSVAVVFAGGIGAAAAATGAAVVSVGLTDRDAGKAANVSSRIDASAATVGALIQDPVFICQLLPNCVSMTAKGGANYTAKMEIPGLPTDQDVAVHIGTLTNGSLPFSYSAHSGLGSASSRATISVVPAGSASVIRYRTTSVTSSGVLGRVIARQAASAISSGITSANAHYQRFAAAQYPTSMTVVGVPAKVRKNKKFAVRVNVSLGSPLVVAPTGSGRATVFINTKRACVINVSDSTGICKPKAPAKGRVRIDVSFKGSFSDGTPAYLGATVNRKVR